MDNYFRKGIKNSGTYFISTLLITVFLQGCGAIGDIKDTVSSTTSQVTGQLENAVTKLSEQSTNWQTTLKELEDKLRKDGESLIANEVTQLAEKGIAKGGAELRCDADFIRTRMSQDLQRIVARLTKKPIPPIKPALCQVIPDHVDMGHLPNQLTYHGYDLNPNNTNLILKHDGGEESLNQFKAHPHHYLMALDLTTPSLCGKQNRKIVLRHGSEDVSSINVIRKICPGPAAQPSREPEIIHLSTSHPESCGALCGFSVEPEFGSDCAPGYERSRYLVNKVSGDGWCSADGEFNGKQLGWVDPGNPNNCRVRVHFGGGWGHRLTCQVVIYQIGKEKPIPPTPDCGCW